MKKPLYFILCLLTLVVFLLIFIQRQWHPFKTTPLNGVGEEVHFPDDIGFREPLIRVYNQYLWDCHHQTNVESILVGKQHYLYNTDFVDDFLGLHWQNYAPDFTSQVKSGYIQNICPTALPLPKTTLPLPTFIPYCSTVSASTTSISTPGSKRLRIVYPMPFIPSWALVGPTLPPCMSPTPFCATWNDKETSPCHNFPSAKPCMTPP